MTAPIAPELAATPSRAFDGPADPPRPACRGCGAHHGSVGEHLRCLGASIAALRAELAAQTAELQWAAVRIGNLLAARSPAPAPSSKKKKGSP